MKVEGSLPETPRVLTDKFVPLHLLLSVFQFLVFEFNVPFLELFVLFIDMVLGVLLVALFSAYLVYTCYGSTLLPPCCFLLERLY